MARRDPEKTKAQKKQKRIKKKNKNVIGEPLGKLRSICVRPSGPARELAGQPDSLTNGLLSFFVRIVGAAAAMLLLLRAQQLFARALQLHCLLGCLLELLLRGGTL